MTKTQSTQKSTTGKAPSLQLNEQFYIVGYTPNGRLNNHRPQLIIKGRRLEQPSFYVDCFIIIKTEQDKLVVELVLQERIITIIF